MGLRYAKGSDVAGQTRTGTLDGERNPSNDGGKQEEKKRTLGTVMHGHLIMRIHVYIHTCTLLLTITFRRKSAHL